MSCIQEKLPVELPLQRHPVKYSRADYSAYDEWLRSMRYRVSAAGQSKNVYCPCKKLLPLISYLAPF